jgi:hypothetical protein
MIVFDTAEGRESAMIVALGVREDPATARLVAWIEREGIACGSCGLDACEDRTADSYRDAIGVGLCARCYDVAGLENEHSDGYHVEDRVGGCPDCEGDPNAGVDGGAWAE